jgi:hypothetical protein
VNANESATREFLQDATPLPLTRAETVDSLRIRITGGQELCKFLLEKAQKAINLGDANSAILLKGEIEGVRRVLKVQIAELEQVEAEQIGATLQKRYPGFFERREVRQTSLALGKSEEIVLANRAELASADRRAWKGQKVNRNIAPARKGVGDLLSMGDGGNSVSAKSMCARHCQRDGKDVQGRSSCSYCNGAGYSVALKLREGKDAK